MNRINGALSLVGIAGTTYAASTCFIPSTHESNHKPKYRLASDEEFKGLCKKECQCGRGGGRAPPPPRFF